MPVSYTHLDVYKRQVTDRALYAAPDGTFMVSTVGLEEVTVALVVQMCIRDRYTIFIYCILKRVRWNYTLRVSD